MEIEFDSLSKCYFMKLEKILEYWGRDPATFSTLEAGEELFYKQLVLCCGVFEQTVFNIMTYSLVCETNQVSSRPKPVTVVSALNFHGFDHDISIKSVKCSSCEGKCKHVAAVLIYLNRHDISCLPEYVGKDLSTVRSKIMANFYNDSDEDDEEEVVPRFTIFDGRKYDNSEGVPPRERFHIRFCEAVDKSAAERKAKEKAEGKTGPSNSDEYGD